MLDIALLILAKLFVIYNEKKMLKLNIGLIENGWYKSYNYKQLFLLAFIIELL